MKGVEELIEITSLHSHIEAIRRDKQRNRQSEREASRENAVREKVHSHAQGMQGRKGRLA